MKNSILLTISTIILGLCGALLRAKQLMYGFETDTGLPVRSGTLFGSSLFVLTIFVIFCFFLYMIINKNKIAKCDYHLFQYIKGYSQVLIRVLSAFLMFLSGVIGIYLFLHDNSVSLLIIALLSLVSGSGVIFLTLAQKRNRLSEEHLICAAAPVFWSSFLLIYCFREHSANPVISSFSYELFALTVSMLAIFYFSGIFYARPYLGRTLFTSFVSIFLIITAFGGRLLYDILSANNAELFSTVFWFTAMTSILLFVAANVNLLSEARGSKH
ncbi:MAG: hypothetical protein N2Z65_04055 [Clostridiales bacterium]|nr:hypothetical protein [Clostridiales bacterium]